MYMDEETNEYKEIVSGECRASSNVALDLSPCILLELRKAVKRNRDRRIVEHAIKREREYVHAWSTVVVAQIYFLVRDGRSVSRLLGFPFWAIMFEN